jgi:hypothetical protein
MISARYPALFRMMNESKMPELPFFRADEGSASKQTRVNIEKKKMDTGNDSTT